MDFTSELLARLQKGESVDALAAELTKAINDAHTENERLKAEAEAKRKADAAASRAKLQKVQHMDDLLDAVVALLCDYNVDRDLVDEIGNIHAEELIDEIDKAVPAIQEYMDLMEKLRQARPVTDTAPEKQSKNDPIEDFLNKFVR